MNFTKDQETPLDSRTEHLRKWYDQNALKFKEAAAIEHAFTKMTTQEQHRLNRFKLWYLEHGDAVSLLGKRVLEFGCGHGRLAIELQGYASYLGVDFCSELVDIGQARIARAGLADKAQLVISDCLRFDGPKDYFDVVCSLGMFAFVEDAEAVLRKMCLHLKPGGTLFIDGHHASPLYNRIHQLRTRWVKPSGATTGGIHQAFTKNQLHSLFSTVGLSNCRIVMREYPFLPGLYACRSWEWSLHLRNYIADVPWLDFLGTDFFALGTKAG